MSDPDQVDPTLNKMFCKMAGEVLRQIERRDHFVLTSHARPDGDAIGSALACSRILHSMGKRAEVVLRDGVPAIYGVLPFVDTVVHSNLIKEDYEAAIILECDSLERTALEGFGRQFLINIDHHFSGRPFAHVNWIDPKACATAEMVFRLARLAGVPVSPDMATCLYTGLLTDTGAFCYTGTNQSTFALARELVRCGADPVRVAQDVYFSSPTSKMRLLGCALSNLHRDGSLTWMFVTRDEMESCGALDEDCEGLVNYALGIEGVEVAAFFRELADRRRWRVSLRSKGHVNVTDLAERFGGGGHACASGFSMNGPLSVAVERILAQLRIKLRTWTNSVQ
jgi:bifunctional oligoribonuclease and PAP phosphatase NrnA